MRSLILVVIAAIGFVAFAPTAQAIDPVHKLCEMRHEYDENWNPFGTADYDETTTEGFVHAPSGDKYIFQVICVAHES